MQTLISPASVTKRKQACQSCRNRKKRCNGERPSCSLCARWGIFCEYTVPASSTNQSGVRAPAIQFTGVLSPPQTSLYFDVDRVGALDSLLFPGQDLHLGADVLSNSGPEYPTPAPSHGSELWVDIAGDSTQPSHVDPEQEFSDQTGLPSEEVLAELVELFFTQLYHLVPCFHKVTFTEELECGVLKRDAPSILYAMCAMAALHHHDPSVKAQQQAWFELAKLQYELSPRNPHPALRTIQTAVLICLVGLTVGDFSASWLAIGKAWRQVCTLRLNRLDLEDGSDDTFETVSRKPSVREEYRRTLWMLFIMDRNHSMPTGSPHAIDERHFKINMPVAEEGFQAMTSEDSDIHKPTPFTQNLNTLISSSPTSGNSDNIFHYICIGHILLGRVSEQIHSLHSSPDSPEYAQECEALDSLIIKFRLSLPRSATSILEASSETRLQAVWLNVTIDALAILLHYRCASLTSDTPSTAQAQEDQQFTLALTAARNIVQLIKDASRISTDLLLNPHIGGSFYIAACVLIIHWRLTGDSSIELDIDIFKLLLARFEERYAFLGLKFGLALQRVLERSVEEMRGLRESGMRGMLADCSKWSFVKERAAEKGMWVT